MNSHPRKLLRMPILMNLATPWRRYFFLYTTERRFSITPCNPIVLRAVEEHQSPAHVSQVSHDFSQAEFAFTASGIRVDKYNACTQGCSSCIAKRQGLDHDAQPLAFAVRCPAHGPHGSSALKQWQKVSEGNFSVQEAASPRATLVSLACSFHPPSSQLPVAS